jgi:hypothetical protein
MISQPTTNVLLIQKRQQIIQELVHNDALREKCSAILVKMRNVEPLFYDLHTLKELKELDKTLYFGSIWAKMGLNRPFPLSFSTRMTQLTSTVGSSSMLIMAIIGIKYGPKTLAQAQGGDSAATSRLLLGSYFSLISPILSLLSLSVMKQQANAMLNMQERLIGASTYFRGMKQIVYDLGMNSIIRQALPELKTISQELHYSAEKSHDFNEFNYLISKSTFNEGNPSYFSSIGNILVAYQEFMKESVRLEYAQAKNLLGELDVYVALAQKIKAHESTPAPFCFTQLTTHTEMPVFQAQAFWNPFIEPNKVVTNDICLNSGNERNIILTGPNTGGKSTFMKAVMINALLAHTFGIAAAQSMTITPCAKLLSYLNISDDTAAGISLFKAEVKRAQELMETLRNLKPHEFALVIIDEIFTGTAPEKAEELSYKFMKQLSEFKNCIFIDATHFKKLVELEEETNGICKNYHTGVILDPTNPSKVAQYTYKLTPGPSPINNAQQVAEEAGVFNF